MAFSELGKCHALEAIKVIVFEAYLKRVARQYGDVGEESCDLSVIWHEEFPRPLNASEFFEARNESRDILIKRLEDAA